jgi:predicted dehydrogenase
VKLQGALFGCGMISEFHLRGWSRIPEVEIVALCNRTAARAEERRQQFVPEARVYTSLDALLASESLDFIDILTTPELHAVHCRAAMAAGLHIVCQKPLCESLESASALAAEAGRYPRCFSVHENHRYRPWFQDVLTLLHSGALGPLRFVRVEHLNATGPAVAYKQQAPTGVWLEYGSHLVDMMRALLGEPLAAHARMHHLNSSVRGESLLHATYDYPGCTAVVAAGWKQAALTQGSVLLCGAAGEVWYEGSLTRGDSGRLRVSAGPVVLRDETISPHLQYVESFYLLQREFIDALLGRNPIKQTAEQNLRTLITTFAAYDSASTGQVVRL